MNQIYFEGQPGEKGVLVVHVAKVLKASYKFIVGDGKIGRYFTANLMHAILILDKDVVQVELSLCSVYYYTKVHYGFGLIT